MGWVLLGIGIVLFIPHALLALYVAGFGFAMDTTGRPVTVWRALGMWLAITTMIVWWSIVWSIKAARRRVH